MRFVRRLASVGPKSALSDPSEGTVTVGTTTSTGAVVKQFKAPKGCTQATDHFWSFLTAWRS